MAHICHSELAGIFHGSAVEALRRQVLSFIHIVKSILCVDLWKPDGTVCHFKGLTLVQERKTVREKVRVCPLFHLIPSTMTSQPLPWTHHIIQPSQEKITGARKSLKPHQSSAEHQQWLTSQQMHSKYNQNKPTRHAFDLEGAAVKRPTSLFFLLDSFRHHRNK